MAKKAKSVKSTPAKKQLDMVGKMMIGLARVHKREN